MSRIDQFSSVFKAAAKTVFHPEPVAFGKALIVSDLEEYQARLFADRLKAFLKRAPAAADIEWAEVAEPQLSVPDLLQRVEEIRPDLICTYRNLYCGGTPLPYSLGEHLDVLTQVTSVPVLVLPRLDDAPAWAEGVENTDSVMAMTDHLTGDDRMVNTAAACTQRGGTLHLTHIEDEATFERYMDAISKLPSIDTESAGADLLAHLLKEPADFIRSCADKLEGITVHPLVRKGCRLAEHSSLIEEHDVDLLVLNTRDDDQLAMHGLAHPLAIELRKTPLLML